MLIVNKFFLDFFKRKKLIGTTIFPFIIFWRGKGSFTNIDLNHERIHIRQQLELLIIFFYILYGLEYLIKGIKYRDFDKAYYNISFEKEAYKNEKNLNYNKDKKIYSFIKYIRDNERDFN